MTKKERTQTVKDMMEAGEENATIINLVSKEAGVSKQTIKNDLKAIEKEAAKGDDFVYTFDLDDSEENRGRKRKYTVKDDEQTAYHVEIEAVIFSPNTGKKISNPSVMKIAPAIWAKTGKAYKGLGYSYVKVLHDPTK